MKSKLKESKSILKKILVITIIIVLVVLPASMYLITKDDAGWKEGDPANTPYAVQQYSSDVSIDGEGNVSAGMTAQELWDQMLEDGSRVDTYLSNPEELQRLINAQRVTDYLDTRKKEDLDKEIDWEKINKDVDSTEVQGIVKLKRAKENGNVSQLVYTDPETFYKYINQYNDTGSEADKNKALSYFTLEKEFKTSMISNAGIIYGTGDFKKFDLTEDQLRAIATVCQTEQDPTKGAAAEASLMANHMDLNTGNAGNYSDTGEGLYNYVKNGGWFANASSYMDSFKVRGETVRDDVVEAVRAVLVNGMRVLPGYVDEHDCFSDITSASNNGQSISVESRSQYVQHVTKLANRYGANYTFYSFPESTSDPFGYTSQANREKIGDFYYEFETGNEVNKKDTETEDTETEENEEELPEVLYWPAEGTSVTSPFGMRIHPIYNEPRMHRGIDIGAAMSSNIYATEAGTVTGASYYSSAGNMVTIDHGNGYITKYMHNSAFKVSVGEKVSKGQLIALAGSTGDSTGPHLHFQIEYNGEPVDPLSFKYNNGMGGGAGGIGSDSSTLSTTTVFYARVATWSEVTEKKEVNDLVVDENTTYTMTSTKINYQDLVSGYRMPFDYLWALLVVSQEKEFVFDLANLVYDSEIDITVHDNLTINTNVSTETYIEKTKVVTDPIKVDVSYNIPDPANPEETLRRLVAETGGPLEDELETEYKEVNTIITKNNTLDVKVTKADVWIVNYEQEFKQESPPVIDTPSDYEYDDEEYPEAPDKTVYNDPAGLAKGFRDKKYNEYAALYTEVKATLMHSESDCYIKKIDRKKHIDNSLQKTGYVSSPSVLEEKTDKNSTEPNFVTILIENRAARERIISGSTWLFEILESGPNTSNPDMAELTKYLLYKATGKDYGVTEFDFSIFDPKFFNTIAGVAGAEGGLSLTTTMFTKDIFKQALQAYYDKTGNTNFYNNFLAKVDELYDSSIANNVNPELVVITARGEGNFKESGGRYNYWGIGVPNGASSGYSYSSLSDGIAGYAGVLEKYVSGSYAATIMQRYEERKAAGCDPLGYGMPGTLSGMQSIYSFLGKHEYGSAGAGGYYYMDPARAGVTKIYKTHEEFLTKCKDSGLPEHASGTTTTVWEQGQYTAWQVESKLKYWDEIFGSFGSRSGSGGNQSIVTIAKSKIGCPYVYGDKGPNSFDCSGFVYWCYKENGITVPSSTAGYKSYIGSNKEISWGEAQPGDILIVMAEERGTKDGHAAIYLGDGAYIHAPGTGKTVTIVETGASSKFKHVFRFN